MTTITLNPFEGFEPPPKSSSEETGGENFADSFSFLFAGISVLPQSEQAVSGLVQNSLIPENALQQAFPEGIDLPEAAAIGFRNQPVVFEDLQKFSASFKTESKDFQAFGNEIQSLLGSRNMGKKDAETFNLSSVQFNVLDAAKASEVSEITLSATSELVQNASAFSILNEIPNSVPANAPTNVPVELPESLPDNSNAEAALDAVPEKPVLPQVSGQPNALPNVKAFENANDRAKEASVVLSQDLPTTVSPKASPLETLEVSLTPNIHSPELPVSTPKSAETSILQMAGVDPEKIPTKTAEFLAAKFPFVRNERPATKAQPESMPFPASELPAADLEIPEAQQTRENLIASGKTNEIPSAPIQASIAAVDFSRRKLPSLAIASFEMKGDAKGQNLDIEVGKVNPAIAAEPTENIAKTSLEASVQPIHRQVRIEYSEPVKHASPKFQQIAALKNESPFAISSFGTETQNHTNNPGSELPQKLAEALPNRNVESVENTAKFSKMIQDISNTIHADHTSPQIAQTALSTPEQKLRETDIVKQIDTQITQLADFPLRREEKQILRIKLNPEELGSVEIQIEKTPSGTISAHFRTDNDSAKQILTNNLEQLRESLQNLGMQVDKLEISNGNSNAAGQQFRENSQRNLEAVENSLSTKNLDENIEHAADLTPTGSNRLVNLRA